MGLEGDREIFKVIWAILWVDLADVGYSLPSWFIVTARQKCRYAEGRTAPRAWAELV